ncbi:Uncharacterized protein PECH_003722 [Penicillium ucsense]|uniref:SUN domain-containing protein n=1 Tax=Penicillium ucsense TaxID=2839758 RepID=A0A8J8WLP9_9EURO|nr:Uncharacterized protein PECM_001780 [Penicillium ucsense]KAF7737538.1 Uncharacterized protein PECH_003722 [Penicillium ucsense]
MNSTNPHSPLKAYASDPEDPNSLVRLLDLDLGEDLPIPLAAVAGSYNYGTDLGTALPEQITTEPVLENDYIARKIDAGLDMAERRPWNPPSRRISNGNLDALGTKTRRTAARNPGPGPRRSKRQPTPDQTQLLRSLREATTSSDESDIMPSPPIAQTVSTDASPAADPPFPRRLSELSDETLYPSSLKQRGVHVDNLSVRSSLSRQSSVDNASEVSWNLERDIHEDDLQRTRPGQYREEPHGRDITKPPRRPSGLSMIQDTILEQDEGEEEGEDELIMEPEDDIEELTSPDSPEGWEAPARTIIPQEFRSKTSSVTSNDDTYHEVDVGRQTWSAKSSQQAEGVTGGSWTSKRRIKWSRVLMIVLFPLGLLCCFYYQSRLASLLHSDALGRIRWCLPFGQSPFDVPSNFTDSAAFHGLQSQVRNVDSKVSSLSRELDSLRSELAHSPRAPIDYTGEPPKPAPKINFLSPGNGAIVHPDPKKTSPEAGHKQSFIQKAGHSLLRGKAKVPKPPPAVVALEPWSDIGDCWCASLRNGQSQLTVLFQHPMVPEELVVEHVPRSITLNPHSAPKDIEVWARYGVFPLSNMQVENKTKTSARWSLPDLWPSRTPEVNEPEHAAPSKPAVTKETLPLVVMNTLRIANQGVAEREYSNDPELGPRFYRIGTMKYDIYAVDNVQYFPFDSIIEIPHLRVDQLVFRMKSNWGANQTCIYRLKLHGHL